MSVRCNLGVFVLAVSIIGIPNAAIADDEVDGGGQAITLLPLTFTAVQSQDGRTKFLSTCVLCHKADLSGGFGPPLSGSVFTEKWFVGSVSPLFSFIRANMPRNAPGTLSNEEVSALIAYVSDENGKTAGASSLPTDLTALSGMGFDQPTSSASK
jgi:mono/diheme cytochrome c family protein